MIFALEIFAAWVIASCTLGACLTWLFWYGERRDRAETAHSIFPVQSEYQ